MAKRNFRPRIVEPQIRPDVYGLGVELELYDNVKRITGLSVVIKLQEGTSMEQAQRLVQLLAELGEEVRT